MLAKGTIPNTEPHIRVGIILPGDQITQISVLIPSDHPYYITDGKTYRKNVLGELLQFRQDKNKVIMNAKNGAVTWTISPESAIPIRPAGGLKIRPVLAGRGFHWEKHIEVFLPGSVSIKIYDKRIILINDLPLEDYLMCVATSEMGQACPEALIQAQTIVARSWMLANIEQKHLYLGMDVCNDDCCQRYQGTANLNQHAIDASRTTRGQVLLFENRICDARYSKSCGGFMETFATIWGGEELPYLQNKPDFDQPIAEARLPLTNEENIRSWINGIPNCFCSSRHVNERTLKQFLGAVDDDGTYFRWKFRYTQSEITTLLNEKLKLNAKSIKKIVPLERGGSGRIKFLEIRYITQNGYENDHLLERDVAIRAALHPGFLYSSCIWIEGSQTEEGIPQKFTIFGAGWGHGVGLCQIGALGMALSGYTTSDIVRHYYPGCLLKLIYP